MQITDRFCAKPLMRSVPHRHISRTGELQLVEEAVLSQHRVRISVNGELKANLTCLPQFLVELALGHLMTEGLIVSAEDIVTLSVSESGEEIQVQLARQSEAGSLSLVTPAAWRTEWVFALADRFAGGMPLHGQTFATHSCFLARQGGLLFECEDIGRHNALDKAIGYALRNGIDLKGCLLYSSGRMPADMVKKVIAAGVPVLAGKGSPTAEAAELAQRYGLTLLCAARRDRMKQFSGSEPQDGDEGGRLGMKEIPMVAFSGYSGAGKTTLIEKLIVELRAQGLRLAVIKHDGHDFEMDREGKDSWRFAKAGAEMTLICSEVKTAMIEQRTRTLRQNLEWIHDVDLILVEGYKYEPLPRIGVCRKASGKGLPAPVEEYFAVVTDDEKIRKIVPERCCGPEEIRRLSALIRERFQI